MLSKTPIFDEKLDQILDKLSPVSKNCFECKKDFFIGEEDIHFYKMLRVPPPTLCPTCRSKRRLGHLMRVPKFFKKKCSAPGHTEDLITIYPPSSPHKIYDVSFFHSDEWDAAAFGRKYDSSRSFLNQFKELYFSVPHLSLEHDPMGINVDYSVGGKECKNIYYTAMGFQSQDCMYSIDVRFSNSVFDSQLVTKCEQCYECVESAYSSHSKYLTNCSHCIECFFLYDSKNCSNCFMSANLRNQSYIWKGEQCTKEEYEKRIQEIDFGDQKTIQKFWEDYQIVLKNALRRSVSTVNCVNCIGNALMACKDCYFVFQTLEAEHCSYLQAGHKTKDALDVTNTIESEQLYECVAVIPGYSRFSMYLRGSSFMEYCSECYHCNHCFGCVSLRNKEFYILNKPYTEDEYWKKIDEIKSNMLVAGEYGEFFSLRDGLLPYQSSSGQFYFPLSAAEAKEKRIPWYDEPESNIPQNITIKKSEEISFNIKDVSDDILKEAIFCEVTGKPFRIISEELRFYKKFKIPLPRKHPWQRMLERNRRATQLSLFPFVCPSCKKSSFSIYSDTEQKEYKILCEPCYLKKVN